jgi:hypothetical protein
MDTSSKSNGKPKSKAKGVTPAPPPSSPEDPPSPVWDSEPEESADQYAMGGHDDEDQDVGDNQALAPRADRSVAAVRQPSDPEDPENEEKAPAPKPKDLGDLPRFRPFSGRRGGYAPEDHINALVKYADTLDVFYNKMSRTQLIWSEQTHPHLHKKAEELKTAAKKRAAEIQDMIEVENGRLKRAAEFGWLRKGGADATAGSGAGAAGAVSPRRPKSQEAAAGHSPAGADRSSVSSSSASTVSAHSRTTGVLNDNSREFAHVRAFRKDDSGQTFQTFAALADSLFDAHPDYFCSDAVKVRFVKNRLLDKYAAMTQSGELKDDSTWPDLREQLHVYFDGANYARRIESELNDMRMRPHESVEDFFLKYQGVLSNAPPANRDNPWLMATRFMKALTDANGLRTEVERIVNTAELSNTKLTIHDIRAAAVSVEKRLGQSKERQTRDSRQSSSGPSQPSKRPRDNSDDSRDKDFTQRKRRQRVRCDKCKRRGHLARDCPGERDDRDNGKREARDERREHQRGRARDYSDPSNHHRQRDKPRDPPRREERNNEERRDRQHKNGGPDRGDRRDKVSEAEKHAESTLSQLIDQLSSVRRAVEDARDLINLLTAAPSVSPSASVPAEVAAQFTEVAEVFQAQALAGDFNPVGGTKAQRLQALKQRPPPIEITISVNGLRAQGLYDPGSNASFVSDKFARENKLPLTDCYVLVKHVQLQQNLIVCRKYLKDATVQFRDRVIRTDLLVLDHPAFTQHTLLGRDVLGLLKLLPSESDLAWDPERPDIRDWKGDKLKVPKDIKEEDIVRPKMPSIPDSAKHLDTEDDVKQREELIASLQELKAANDKVEGFCTHPLAEVPIDLTDDTPIRIPQYSIPYTRRPAVTEAVKKWSGFQRVYARTDFTEWNLPLTTAPKWDEEHMEVVAYRVCADCRHINNRLKDVYYPIPNIRESLNMFAGCKYFFEF